MILRTLTGAGRDRPNVLGGKTLAIKTLAMAGLAAAVLCAAPFDAWAAGICKPSRPRSPIVLKDMGPCDFDAERASFAGDPAQQAACLLRSTSLARLGPPLEHIPDTLASRMGQTAGLPDRDALAALLVELDLAWDFAAFLWQPVTRARDNDPTAPAARYLVIHDTSGPNLGGRPWPPDLDANPKINNLARFRCSDNWELSHVVINRSGAMLLGHDFAVPWRATKFERAAAFGTALKGLFLHVEMIQPRRHAAQVRRRNDFQAPLPGFTPEQYERLALVYVIASVRAGSWLIPAFHAPIDDHIRGGHDDPRNFDLEAFAQSLDGLVERLREAGELAAFVP
jgi:hypothetical protein